MKKVLEYLRIQQNKFIFNIKRLKRLRQHLTLVEKLIYRLKNCQAFYSRTIQCFLLKSSNAFNHLMHSMMFPGYIVSPSLSNWGLRFVVLPASNHKTKTAAKTLYLTLKQWNRWGLRFLVLPAPNYKTETLSKNVILDAKTLKSVESLFFSFTSYW